MTMVAVNRLAVAAPAGRLADARMRVEDALRLVAVDDDRLFVFRRFDFGVMPQAARSSIWYATADKMLKSLTASAVHASSPSAAASHAVWFRSRHEANALLLRLLARGIAPNAWFWRLAVRDWQGISLNEWLPQLFALIRNDQSQRVTVARALIQALEEVGGGAIIPALAGLPNISRGALSVGVSKDVANLDMLSLPTDHIGTAVTVIARHHPAVQRQLAQILPDARQDLKARYWLALVAITAVAIELDAKPAQFAALANLILTKSFWDQFPLLVSSAEHKRPRARGNAPIVAEKSIVEPHARHHASVAADQVTPLVEGQRTSHDDMTVVNALRVAKNIIPPSAPLVTTHELERRSTAAGLWLVIPSLCKMGLAEWLDQKNRAEWSSFGHLLLAHMAQRQRVTPDDPALANLWLDTEISAEWLSAWRVGLDRWLRRRARIRLCDLVRKRGWISVGDASVTVRFNPHDADVRLRRFALDLDPGWVPWLGLAVRYEYCDRKLR